MPPFYDLRVSLTQHIASCRLHLRRAASRTFRSVVRVRSFCLRASAFPFGAAPAGRSLSRVHPPISLFRCRTHSITGRERVSIGIVRRRKHSADCRKTGPLFGLSAQHLYYMELFRTPGFSLTPEGFIAGKFWKNTGHPPAEALYSHHSAAHI